MKPDEREDGMSRLVAGVSIGRAYRIEADDDGELIGFVYKGRDGTWRNDRSSERFFSRHEAIEVLQRDAGKVTA
jgi:hypothetical protein